MFVSALGSVLIIWVLGRSGNSKYTRLAHDASDKSVPPGTMMRDTGLYGIRRKAALSRALVDAILYHTGLYDTLARNALLTSTQVQSY